MDKLYVAVLLKKNRVKDRNIYICKYSCIIVGILFGTYFLSSRSLKYRPMINYNFSNNSKIQYIDDYNNKNSFLDSDEIYCYYALEEVKDYNDIENIINNCKKNNCSVSYFINLEESTPYIFKYLDK